MKIFLLAFSLLILCGCATTPNLNSISLGMTKDEVIKTLGNPSSVSAKDNVEYLRYTKSLAFNASTYEVSHPP